MNKVPKQKQEIFRLFAELGTQSRQKIEDGARKRFGETPIHISPAPLQYHDV
jgi:hypothetical protein